MRPQISVVIPTYNRARLLPEAIASVLDQDESGSMEVVVVDDGSTDGTPDLVLPPAVRVYRQPNAGPAAARNLGARMSQGKILAFLDSDDLWTPGRLAPMLTLLYGPPPEDMVYCLLQDFQHDEGQLVNAPYPQPTLPGLLCWRSIWERLGGLDESMPSGEDLDFFKRASDLSIKPALDPQVGLLRRLHEGNLTRSSRVRDQGFLDAVRQNLIRNRGKNTKA